MQVFIEDGSSAYTRLFESLGYELVHNPHACDLVCFTGGEDVSPDLYGDTRHHYTHSSITRDTREAILFKIMRDKGTPMVGICRGGQFLNVMNGGRMYQHVEKHTSDHLMEDARTGEQLFVSSTHHQMFMPSPEAILVASSTLGGSREWYEKDEFKKDVAETDYEVLYYPETKCLCFQPHPEFSSPRYEGMREYFGKLLIEFFPNQ